MVAYTVYEPRYTADDPIERAEQLVFVKDGFHWWAAIFPALWLMVKGLWLEFAACLVVIGLLAWGIKALGVNRFGRQHAAAHCPSRVRVRGRHDRERGA